jgi:hypothetical protein
VKGLEPGDEDADRHGLRGIADAARARASCERRRARSEDVPEHIVVAVEAEGELDVGEGDAVEAREEVVRVGHPGRIAGAARGV